MSANRRIAKEFNDLRANPVEGVAVEPDEANVLHWTGFMAGPSGSFYHGGRFKIDITFPLEYPFKAPAIKFLTRIYHPNITQDGLLCVGLLKPDAWKPSVRVEHVLRTIVNLLIEPNPEDAVVASIAEQYIKDFDVFKATAQDHVQKVSTCTWFTAFLLCWTKNMNCWDEPLQLRSLNFSRTEQSKPHSVEYMQLQPTNESVH